MILIMIEKDEEKRNGMMRSGVRMVEVIEEVDDQVQKGHEIEVPRKISRILLYPGGVVL